MSDLRKQLEEFLDDIPSCDKHPEGSAVSCGWKSAIESIRYLIEHADDKPASDANAAWEKWVRKVNPTLDRGGVRKAYISGFVEGRK